MANRLHFAGRADLRFLAEQVLTAALETGTLIAVPQDEQGRERLVDLAVDGLRVEAGYDDEPDETVAAGMYHQARAVLQALGLLPELATQHPCPDCEGRGYFTVQVPGDQSMDEDCDWCRGTGLLPEQEEAK